MVEHLATEVCPCQVNVTITGFTCKDSERGSFTLVLTGPGVGSIADYILDGAEAIQLLNSSINLTPYDPSQSNRDQNINIHTIIGISTGGAAIVVIIAVVIVFAVLCAVRRCYRRKKTYSVKYHADEVQRQMVEYSNYNQTNCLAEMREDSQEEINIQYTPNPAYGHTERDHSKMTNEGIMPRERQQRSLQGYTTEDHNSCGSHNTGSLLWEENYSHSPNMDNTRLAEHAKERNQNGGTTRPVPVMSPLVTQTTAIVPDSQEIPPPLPPKSRTANATETVQLCTPPRIPRL